LIPVITYPAVSVSHEALVDIPFPEPLVVLSQEFTPAGPRGGERLVRVFY
jgi:hypothetical protein